MKLTNMQKDFSMYDSENNPVGVLRMTPNSKADSENGEDVEISIMMASDQTLTFEGISEFKEFVEFVLKNAE